MQGGVGGLTIELIRKIWFCDERNNFVWNKILILLHNKVLWQKKKSITKYYFVCNEKQNFHFPENVLFLQLSSQHKHFTVQNIEFGWKTNEFRHKEKWYGFRRFVVLVFIFITYHLNKKSIPIKSWSDNHKIIFKREAVQSAFANQERTSEKITGTTEIGQYCGKNVSDTNKHVGLVDVGNQTHVNQWNIQ